MEIEMVLELCASCGIPFAISRDLQGRLKKCHNTFYCPAGHGQSYKSETEEEILRRKVAQQKREIEYSNQVIIQLRKDAEKKNVKRKPRSKKP